MQHECEDSPEFLAMRASGQLSQSPFRDALRHPRQVVLVTAVAASWCVAIYMGFVWLPEYEQDIEDPRVPGASHRCSALSLTALRHRLVAARLDRACEP